jgi:hypothetical protein
MVHKFFAPEQRARGIARRAGTVRSMHLSAHMGPKTVVVCLMTGFSILLLTLSGQAQSQMGDPHLPPSVNGISPNGAWTITENAIRATNEWRGKH